MPPSRTLPTHHPSTDRSTTAHELLREAADADTVQAEHDLHVEVVLLHSDVARSVAHSYAGRGIALEDLQQVAFEGLVKAVERFDPARGHDFMSFAMPTIRGEVQRHFRDQGWTVRPPRRIQEAQGRVHRATDELAQELGHTPSTDEVADRLGLSLHEVGEALEAHGAFSPASLDRPVDREGDGASLGDLLPDPDADEHSAEARVMLAPVVRRLSERDQQILYLRYCRDLTQQEIGDDIGVTQMQVSRILTRVHAQLREDLEAT